tara:strand:- start:73 stop:381 length:309 start_codon:yes stop_codon:yes gene_type:complete
MVRISFNETSINSTVQIGDIIYEVVDQGNPQLVGPIVDIGPSHIDVETENTITPSSFIIAVKDKGANTSGIKGYYAKVKMTFNQSTETELFAVSSEITQSSK